LCESNKLVQNLPKQNLVMAGKKIDEEEENMRKNR
jgi:hypothetical protein